MKKCEFCDRSFGQEAFRRHSLHCAKGISHPHGPDGQEDKLVIKSDDFMQRLEEEFLHAFGEEKVSPTNSMPSSQPDVKPPRVIVNPSPRIIFQEIVRQQERGLIVSPEYLPRKKRPSTPGEWRTISRNKPNRDH